MTDTEAMILEGQAAILMGLAVVLSRGDKDDKNMARALVERSDITIAYTKAHQPPPPPQTRIVTQ